MQGCSSHIYTTSAELYAQSITPVTQRGTDVRSHCLLTNTLSTQLRAEASQQRIKLWNRHSEAHR
jgi:hypothetical protein